jgi:predicted phage terminase large subunit-like protein
MGLNIASANYQQIPIDLEGRLYKEIKTYTEPPPYFEAIKNYTDTADQGDDYLCSIVFGVFKGEAYILDVLYTKDGMEITEPATAELLHKNNVAIAIIESNNGGRGFARNVERELWERHQSKKTKVAWFHQSKNKTARILSSSATVMNCVYFPVNWKEKWFEFYKAVTTYQKEGKNKHDDAPDALTGVVESLIERKLYTMPRRGLGI